MARETQSSVIERIAARSGFTEFGYIPVSGLRFSEDIRKICEGNSCRNYGTSWACPPAVGTLEECRRRVGQYDTMLLFTKKYELESSFDFEAMGAGLGDFKKAVDRFHKALDPVLPEFLLMSNEGCGAAASFAGGLRLCGQRAGRPGQCPVQQRPEHRHLFRSASVLRQPGREAALSGKQTRVF